jgi:ParB-like chromosome segregation protein Spo0J
MRLKACIEVGLKEVFIVKAEDLTEQQKDEFIVKDNVGFGEWDWDILANEWDEELLNNWGLDVPTTNDLNEKNLFNIEIPFYTPSEIIPNINELAYLEKTKELINKIDKLNIEKELKEILKARAAFFTDFNFNKIADFYSKQTPEVKEIFEDLGMVILAPKEALEKGFIELYNFILEL